MRRLRPGRVVLVATCALTGVWLVVPTLVVVPTSVSPTRLFTLPPDGISGAWYANFFTDPRWLKALGNSLLVATLATVVATVVGTLAALALDRSRLRGRGFLSAFFMTPLIVPVILVGLGIYYTFLRWDLAGTVTGLVLAHAVLGIPLVIRSVSASLSGFDRRLEAAAANLGAPPTAVLRQVTLPVVMPGVLAGAVFAFITSFDEVVISIFLCSPDLQTLPVLMFNAVTVELDPTIAAASSMIVAFTTLLILIGLKVGGREESARAF